MWRYLLFWLGASTEVNIYTRPGYYFGYQCQLSVEVTSQQFKEVGTEFHVEAVEGFVFLEQDLYSEWVLKLVDGREVIPTRANDCVVEENELFQCARIHEPTTQHQERALKENAYTFRLPNAICPVGEQIRARVTAVMGDLILTLTLSPKLSNLTYKQVSSIHLKSLHYLVNCETQMVLKYTMWNHTKLDSWASVEIQFQDLGNIIVFDSTCSHDCSLRGGKLLFVNQKRKIYHKDYTFPSYELYPLGTRPKESTFRWRVKFLQKASVRMKVTIFAQIDNRTTEIENIMQLNDSNVSIFGQQSFIVQAFDGQAFPYNYTEAECENTTPSEQWKKSQIGFFTILVLGLLFLFIRSQFFTVEKYLYVILLLANWGLKWVYWSFQPNSSIRTMIKIITGTELALTFLSFLFMSIPLLLLRPTVTKFFLAITTLCDFRFGVLCIWKMYPSFPFYLQHLLYLGVNIIVLAFTTYFILEHNIIGVQTSILIFKITYLIYGGVIYLLMALSFGICWKGARRTSSQKIIIEALNRNMQKIEGNFPIYK